MSKNTPAFQYYPADLISDPEVMFWDMEAVGAYWQMITYLWLNGGEFEFKPDNLKVLFRVNRKLSASKLWEKIKNKFVLSDGIVTHKRVSAEINKQRSSRLKRSAAGQKGAETRWNTDGNANGNAIKKTMAKNSSSSSTSSSSLTTKEKNKEKKSVFVKPSLDEVSSYCLERQNGINPQTWMDYYESNGWMVGKNKMRDWRAAVRTWEARRRNEQHGNRPGNPGSAESASGKAKGDGRPYPVEEY